MATRVRILLMLLLLCSVQNAIGQQRSQFTQYLFNQLVLNPAYAGAEEALSVTFSNRNQWVNLEGAPTTQTFTGHSMVGNEHVGAGLSIVNDKIGVHKNLDIAASYAYHVKTGKNSFLSAGLQAGVRQLASDYSQLVGASQDPRWGNQQFSHTLFDMATGLYFKNQAWQAGMSVQNILPGKRTFDDTLSIHFNRSNWFLFLKHRHGIRDHVAVEPSILVKYLQKTSLSVDATLCLVFYDVLTAGVSYRMNESVDFLCRAQFTHQLQVGYAYDYTTGNSNMLSTGSHEVMINYLFRFKTDKLVAPR